MKAYRLKPEVTELIVGLVRQGNYPEVAAKAAGLDGRTFRKWMIRGTAETEGEYFDFAQAVHKAEGEAEARGVQQVALAAANGDTSAAKWKLERRYPERWGAKVQLEVKEQLGRELIERLREKLDPGAFARVAEILLASDDDGSPGEGDDH